jgi:hypothetical protein
MFLEGPLIDEDLAQSLILIKHPGIHCCNQGVAANEVHLQCQDTEQQVAVGGRVQWRRAGHGNGLSWEDFVHD